MTSLRAQLGRPSQVAYAVDDLERAAARFAERTGAGPFFVVEHIALADVRRLDGLPHFDHSSAYGQWGEVMVELVHEHTPPITAPPGLHHVACLVADLPAAVAACTAAGWGEVLRARTTGGLEFSFCDARHELGHLVELYEPSARLLEFYAMVAAAATEWDGARPVRRLSG